MAFIRLDNVVVHFPVGRLKTIGENSRYQDPKVAGRIVETRRGQASVQAIESLTINLEDGDRLGIIGSNGSGKTTLLQVMAGLLSPVAGSVHVDGRVATMLSLGLGMNAEATGLQNIYLSGLVSGATRKQTTAAIDDIIAFTQLSDYLNLPLRTYSHGMAMRLKFACATAFQPDIVLLDEWIGAGDAEFQEKARLRLEALLQNAGIVVIASHNRQLIQRVSNKLLWLERGKVLAMGDPQQVITLRRQAEDAAETRTLAASA